MSTQDNKLFEINESVKVSEPIEIKTSFINTASPNGVMQSEATMLNMLNMKGNSSREDIKQEVKKHLIENGMTIKDTIGKYKDLFNMKPSDEMKVADYLKLLQYLDKLNGVELNEDKQAQQVTNNYLNMVVNKPDNEVIGLIEQTMSKTSEYLQRMKTPTQEDKLKEINDSVHVAK